MYRSVKYYLFSLIAILGMACSTKKNTALIRSYHNLTSYYNILFNGSESFREGMKKLIESYDDDFTETLPVFLYTDKNALASIGPEMDRTIKKSTKLISMHSLTVKPEVKSDKELSQKEKEFFNKKEYNLFVDDAYLLMGKAHFYRMEYPRAKETFSYILVNYPEGNTIFETRIWLARLANEEMRYRESYDILSSLEKNLTFPKQLRGELYSTWADYYLKQQKYNEAIDPLIQAIDFTGNRLLCMRYTYLLAQLYALTGNYSKASDTYDKVIKMNPPYKMTFNAKINRASTYQSGTGSRKDIEKQLQKMLKDDKNIEFQDQIYYALGNLFYTDNMLKEAIEYYKLSIEKSTENTRQKAKSSLTLANIYYNKPEYEFAQAYYDTALSVINADYPGYEDIYTKSVSLTSLVENIRTVEFEDSVLKLSVLPNNELLAFIDELIQKEVREEEERKLHEQELAVERLNTQMENNLLMAESKSGNWYFYNPAAKNAGHKEFLQVWGNRKLEDNWRRKNKSVVGFAESENEEEEEQEVAEGGSKSQKIVTNPKSREFYLQYIPSTDSAREKSLERISAGLLKMGEIYGDELKDYPRAIEAYEKLLERFPDYYNKLQVYYKLYNIAKTIKDIERVSRYQQKIVKEYPNSNFAKLMTNPNYLEEIKNQEHAIHDEYAQTYKQFVSGNYSQALQRSKVAMANYPEHALYSKFDYIYTISAGLKKDTLEFINDLQQLLARYPASDIAENVQIMIAYLQNKAPRVVAQQKRTIAEALFEESPDEMYYFAYVAPSRVNFNQLIFNIVNFNLDNFDDLKLQVKRVGLEGNQSLCIVEKFKNTTGAMEYLEKIKQDPTIFKDVDSNGITPIVISESNYSKLLKTQKPEQYLIFFNEKYK